MTLRSYLLFCIIFTSALLAAQISPYADLIKSARAQVAQQPADTHARMNLAYYQMLDGATAEALSNYQTVLLQDSLNTDAASGVLWAYNTQGKWKNTVQSSARFLKLFPDHAPLHSFRAYALAQQGYHTRARSAYTIATHKDPAPELLPSLNAGLGWAYLALGDYPLARKSFARMGNPDANVSQALAKVHHQIGLHASTNYDSTNAYGADISWVQKRTQAALGFEELFVGGKHLRNSYQGSLGYQANFARITANAGYMDGNDSRVYPASLGSLSIQSRFYQKSLIISPKVSQHFARYQRFDLHQTDASIKLTQQPFSANYSYSYLYQDTDYSGGDSKGAVHSLHLSYSLPNSMVVGLYGSSGDLAWWTSPFGVTIDDFDPVDSYLGISLYVPFLRHYNLLLYHQTGFTSGSSRQLSSINVSYHN